MEWLPYSNGCVRTMVRILPLEVAYPDRDKGPVFQLTSDSLF